MRFALIGMGPTGLLALTKTFSMAKRHPHLSVTVHAFDAQAPGQGVHRSDQPQYLRLNTVAEQLSMFEDGDFSLFPRHAFRPTLYEWMAHEHPHVVRGEQDRFAFLPRKYLGLYLQWYYTQLLERIPVNVHFKCTCIAINAIAEEPDGRFRLVATPPPQGAYDTLLLCTGHGLLPMRGASASSTLAYPLPDTLKAITAGSTVAIQGVGLTAMDVVAALTEGRGGVFERTPAGLHYQPSGQEPLISLYSNSGMPYRARPETDEAVVRHQPLIMTQAALDQLRQGKGDHTLDFEEDLLPLLHQEMQAAYYCACASQYEYSAYTYQSHYHRMRTQLQQAQANGQLGAFLATLARIHGPFDPRDVLACSPPDTVTASEYPRWFFEQLHADLHESALGCRRSPLKKSLEVWRDLRDQLCHAIDYQGLNPDAHRMFYATFCPLINRLVAGPQKERHAELLALIECGVVSVLPGFDATDSFDPTTQRHSVELKRPEPQRFEFEYLIKANFSAHGTRQALLALLAPVIKPGSTPSSTAYSDFTDLHHPVFINEHLQPRTYVFGPPLEGASYYNHYIPSLQRSRVSTALENCLKNAFNYYNHCFTETF